MLLERVMKLKSREIKAARVRNGYSQKDMGVMLGIPTSTYASKENGESPFTDDQKVKIIKILKLTPSQLNDFLYDGILPLGDT